MKIAILLCILATAFAIPAVQVAPAESNSPSGVVDPAAPAAPALTPAQAFEIARQDAIKAHMDAHAKAVELHKAIQRRNEIIAQIPALSLSGGRFEAAPVNLIPGVDNKGCLIGESGKICPTGSFQFVV